MQKPASATHKLASLGLASAMLSVTAMTPATANTADQPGSFEKDGLKCTVIPVEKPADAPTAEQVAAAEQEVSEKETLKTEAANRESHAREREDSAKQNLEAKQTANTAAQENLESAKTQRETAQAALATANQTKAQAQTDLDNALQTSGPDSAAYREAQQRLAEANAAVERAEEKITQLNGQLNDKETPLAEATQKAEEAQTAEQTKRGEVDALGNEITNLQQRNQANQESKNAKTSERARLQSELEGMNEETTPADDTFTRAELVPSNSDRAAENPVTLKANREIALENMAKLLPFASDSVRKRAANLLEENDSLVIKRLTSVIPTADGRMVGDAIAAKTEINGILLHYADRNVERRVIKLDNRHPHDGEVGHYYMAGGVPFTPDQRQNVNSGDNSALVNELKAVEWNTITPNPKAKNSAEEQRGLLYLEQAFNAQKEGVAAQLETLLARESVSLGASFDKATVEAKIREKKNEFLLGLAYVNRFYNVDFGSVNLRDVLVFRRDFYGANDSAIDLLIRLGSTYQLLTPSENIRAYNQLHKPIIKRGELAEALDDLRRQFTVYANFDDWFKATTKAYIVETPSLQVPDRNVQLSQRLRSMGSLKNVLLPILTVPENTIFVTVDMSNISFGSFERYVAKNKPLEEEITRVRERVVDYAKRYRDYYDMWYRIGNDTMKRNIIREIVTWDSLMNPNKKQTPKWGETWSSVTNFFGPIGRWFGDNNSYAYANGSMTWMVDSGILEPGRFGPATFIHEQTHNMDGGVMLGGFGRRQGAFMELYAKSFLENPFNGDYDVFGFNQVDRFDTSPNKNLFYNSDPSRFQNTTDLNQYFKGWFEAIYLLDNAEATAMLERSDAEKAKLFLRLGSTPQTGNRHVNSYELVSEAEISGMNLRSIEDLVEHELMVHRQYGTTGPQKVNGYYNNFLFSPIYGTGESNLGLTGETAFRRNAFEMLAAKGFEDGWVPYVSNKFKEEAVAAGQPNLPDTFIMPKVFAAEGYSSLKEYRKVAYRQAAQRAATTLKPITINFNGQSLTFNNFDELVAKFREIVADDLQRGNENRPRFSKTLALKKALFNALVRQTNEFRTSIFTDGDASLQPWVAPAAEPEAAPYQPVMLDKPENEIRDARFTEATLPAEASTAEENAEKERRRAEIEAQIARLGDEIQDLETQIQQTQTQVTQKQADKDTQEAKLRDLAAESASLRARKEELAREVTDLREQRTAAEGELASGRENAATAQADLTRMEADVQTKQQAVDNAAQSVEGRTQELANAEQNLEAKQREANAAEAALAQAQEEEAEAVASLEASEAEVAATEKSYADAVAARDALVARKAEIDALRDMVKCVAAKDLTIELPIANLPSEETSAEVSKENAASETTVVASERRLPATGVTVGLIGLSAVLAGGAGLLLLRRRQEIANTQK